MAGLSITPRVRPTTHLVGIRGGSWYALVNERGSIRPSDGSSPLDWFVAADDRWHDPAMEGTVRQERRGGLPLIETRLRVPSGDVVQRVYGVVNDGLLIVVEFENQSTLPVAVAVTRGDVLSQRPPSASGVQGISLPTGSVVFPVGHKSTLRVALASGAHSMTKLPEGLADFAQLQRGWSSAIEHSSRLVLPDKTITDAIARTRADILITGVNGIGAMASDPVAYILTLHEMHRMGEKIAEHVAELATAVESILASNSRAKEIAWDVERALFVAQWLFDAVGEKRASGDVSRSQARLAEVSPEDLALIFAAEMPVGVRGIAWVEEQLVSPRRDGGAVLFANSIPGKWLGLNIEAYSLVVDATRTISCALRWHGDLPAMFWEVAGSPGVHLSAGMCDPNWSSNETTGEALLTGFKY